MAGLPRSTIEKGLKAKGFRPEDRDHKLYVFHYKDNKTGKVLKTGIRTKISRSSQKHNHYSDNLLLAMRRQLKIDSKKLLLDLLECTMTIDAYIKLLKSKGYLRDME